MAFKCTTSVCVLYSLSVLPTNAEWAGTGRGHSVLEVVSAMEKVSNHRIPTRLVNRRLGDVGFCVAKSSKAEQELGWKAEKSLHTCCKDIWSFLEGMAK
jgi:UDP-glucose 4-epimerase